MTHIPPDKETDKQGGGLPPQHILIRKAGDIKFEEGVIELFVTESGKLAVTVNKGFEILGVSKFIGDFK